MNPILFEAGAEKTLRHAWGCQLRLPASQAITTIRIVEFWCQMNCDGLWRVDLERNGSVIVSFDTMTDAAMFRIHRLLEKHRPVKLRLTS